MEHTPNLNLKKPGLTDNILISDINENMDVLDAAVSELKNGSASIPDLETADKTLAGAINEVNQQLDTHSGDMAKHNQFIYEGKLHQIGLGYNPTLGCMTYSIREVI